MRRQRLFLSIVTLQLLLLVGLVGLQQYRLRVWRPIRLRVEPRDPAALFRGRYVDLTYEFSRLRTASGEWEAGDDIYVRLAHDRRGSWRVAGFGRECGRRADAVCLRGRVKHVYPETQQVGQGRQMSFRQTGWFTLVIQTEIESYFISERQAPKIDRLPRDRYAMTVDVVVANDGRAALKQLYVRGIPAEEFTP